MGTIIAKIKRPLRRFNIDNRTRAVLSRDKPIPAPKPAAAVKQLKLAQKLNPKFLETHYKKDSKLDEYLKNVYVTSTDPKVPTVHQPKSDRPLPRSRTSEDFEFGFYMPDEVPKGKCTLKQVFDIIIQHKEDPNKYNENFLATEYKLDKETVEKLLYHYKLYQLLLPPKEEDMDIVMHKKLKILDKLGVRRWNKEKSIEDK